MSAREIVAALGGRWHGGYGTARCPAHHPDKHPSLSVRDGDEQVLVRCFAGCEFVDIRDALRRQDLWDGEAPTVPAKPAKPAKAESLDRERHEAVARIWRECQPIEGTAADAYLTGRGVTIPRPTCLRFHPALHHAPSNAAWPALVAAVVDAAGRGRAVQRIYLDPSGRKAPVEPVKISLGSMRGAAVRLGPVTEHIGLSEGIETGLSAMQLYGLPVWAACGPHGDTIPLPREVKRVTVYGDNGQAGEVIAAKVAESIHRRGRPVDIAFPPREFPDFNDALVAPERITA